MATFRGTIPDFQLANPLYVGARVTFYTVDANGDATATLATLYAEPTGTQTSLNPQTLDSEGKFIAPVYIDGPVIASVVGPNVGSHTTGVIDARGRWRGDWTTGTVYFSNDFISDPITGNIYGATNDYLSATSIALDISNGDLELVIDQSKLSAGGASLAIKRSVRFATTGAITLSGLQAVDGATVCAAGDRILVKNQGDPSDNGWYDAAVGPWTRSVDADASGDFADGCIVYVREGDISRGKAYQLSVTPGFVLETSAIAFSALLLPDGCITIDMGCAPDAQLAPSIKGYHTVPYDCTISEVRIFGNRVGSAVLDIYKAPFSGFPPTSSICAGSKPTLANAQSYRDATLSGWTIVLKKGDVLGFELLSVSGLQFLTLELPVTRN